MSVGVGRLGSGSVGAREMGPGLITFDLHGKWISRLERLNGFRKSGARSSLSFASAMRRRELCEEEDSD